MPSNALKTSQLIAVLQESLAAHGELDCVLPIPVDGIIVAIDGRNVNVAGELLGQTLAHPVLAFGTWRDEQGRLRNSPGAVYQATADASEWTYDRARAPEDTDIAVWKRYGGQDVGKRVGDKWFVREGAAEWPPRPVEIIPAGILAWKLL